MPRIDLESFRRPHSRLLPVLVARSFLWGPLFPIPLVLGIVRFRTLRYRFDRHGISMSWGALFRREVSLAYGRIQDLHVVSGPVERTLGLARIQVQTASGSSKAEMTIEGFLEHAALRDALYRRMLEEREDGDAPAPGEAAESLEGRAGGAVEDVTDEPRASSEIVAALDATRREMERLRELLDRMNASEEGQ